MRNMTDELDVAASPTRPGLVHLLDDEPGIMRERQGEDLVYRHPGGERVRDPDTLERIRKLAIPPAWTDVWISPDPRGHIQATGRDAKGRKQYRYHEGWRELRDASKYDRILEFARLLPGIRARVAADMSRAGVCREKVYATIVSLLDTTLARIGNDEYAEQNGSYGLTTLRNRHLQVRGEELRFHFKGKSGRTWKLQVRHKRIARIVRSCQELPGQRLFQFADDDGELRTVSSSDVNEYLREIAGPDVTAKDFRTWAGTVLAAVALSRIGPYASERQARSNIRSAVNEVAERLGNTATICRKCYIHPQVIDCYRAGTLPDIARDERGAVRKGLSRDEAQVLALLRRRLGPRRRPRPLPLPAAA